MNFRKLNVTEMSYKQILVRTYKSRLRLETTFLVEHVTSSTHGLIHLLIEKKIWLTYEAKYLTIKIFFNLFGLTVQEKGKSV